MNYNSFNLIFYLNGIVKIQFESIIQDRNDSVGLAVYVWNLIIYHYLKKRKKIVQNFRGYSIIESECRARNKYI